MLGQVVLTWLPQTSLVQVLRYIAFGFVFLELSLQVRAGYHRRRPHWTRESWRRFLMLAAIPTAAVILLLGFTWAVDLRLPMMGAGGSTLRGLWIGVLLLLLLVAGAGFAIAMSRLMEGEASRQFEWRKRRSRGEA